jgi:hypothetical protein
MLFAMLTVLYFRISTIRYVCTVPNMAVYKGKVRPGAGYEGPEGVEVQLYSFFNLGARCGWVVNATPWVFYHWERDPAPIV